MSFFVSQYEYALELAMALSASLYETVTRSVANKATSQVDQKIAAKKEEVLTASASSSASSSSSSQAAQPKVVKVIRRGIFNVGNSCYMNATLHALFECPFLRAVLEKQVDPKDNPKAEAINACRKKVLELLQKLESKDQEKVPLAKSDAKELLQFLLEYQVKDPNYFTKKSSSEAKLEKQMDAALFLEFLGDYLGLSYTLKNLFLKDVIAKKVIKDDGRDLMVIAISDRFLPDGTKDETSVQPVPLLSSNYELRAVISNPSDNAKAGHYITYVPQKETDKRGWLEYNDDEVQVRSDGSGVAKTNTEKHSYLYFYSKKA